MENEKIYIIPDVHGRQFWLPVLDHLNDNCEIVFLGDYLDPYNHEMISKDFALEQFKEILRIAREHKNVHLLLGNHDLEYMIGRGICYCRCDDYNYNEIKSLFIDNADLFNIAWDTITDDSKKFLFSHAGVHIFWIADNKGIFEESDIYNSEELNELFNSGKMNKILGDISRYRGGFNRAGSIVWADIREYKINIQPSDVVQIVGHTMLSEKPVVCNNVFCLDTKNIFVLDKFGNICEYDKEEPVKFLELK